MAISSTLFSLSPFYKSILIDVQDNFMLTVHELEPSEVTDIQDLSQGLFALIHDRHYVALFSDQTRDLSVIEWFLKPLGQP